MMRYFVLFAFLLTLTVFTPLWDAPFLYDDHHVVQVDAATAQKNDSLDAPGLPPEKSQSEIAFWLRPRPLRHITHWLDNAVWGNNASPPHIENIILHLLCTIFGFLFLVNAGISKWIAFGTAALFAVNPVSVEAVGIVSHRKELLSALFLFSGLGLAIRRQPAFSIGAAICFFLACCGKETAAVFPFLLFALAPSTRDTKKTTAYFLPYLILAICLAVVFYWQIHLGMEAAGRNPGLDDSRAGHFVSGTGFGIALNAAVRSLPRYMLLLVNPFGHTIDPAFDMVKSWGSVPVLLSLVFDLAFVVILCLAYCGKSVFTKPLAWILFALAPYVFPPFLSSGAIEVLADRYAYVASFGAAWLIVELLAKIPRRIGTFAWGAILILYGVCSYQLSGNYKTEVHLWRHVSKCNPKSFLAAHNHAMALWKQNEDFAGAVDEYNRMIAIKPDFAYGYISFAQMHSTCHDRVSALEVLDDGISKNPAFAPLLRNRAIIRCMDGDYSGSIQDFETAEKLGMDDPAFHHAWGVALMEARQWAEASVHYGKGALSPVFKSDKAISEALKADPKAKEGSVLIAGDSLPHGTKAIDGEGKEHTLADLLSRRFSPKEVIFKDISVPGSTSPQLMANLPRILAANPDCAQCVIWVGHNDAFFEATSGEIVSVIARIALECRCHDVRPIILGPVPVVSTPERDRTKQEEILAQVNADLALFCQENGIRFLNVRDLLSSAFSSNDFLDQETGNHLRLPATEKVAEALSRIIGGVASPPSGVRQ